MPIAIAPLKPFGAELDGVNLAEPIGAADFQTILQALHKHSALVLHGQQLTKAQLARFSAMFGILQRHVLAQWLDDDVPEVLLVTSKAAAGSGRAVYSELGSRFWHSDMSINKPSGFATILYGVEVPSIEGGTEIADMYAAYEALPDAMKKKLDGLMAVHDLKYNLRADREIAARDRRKSDLCEVSHRRRPRRSPPQSRFQSGPASR